MAARKLPPTDFIKVLIEQKQSIKQIATTYGVCEESVRNKLYKSAVRCKSVPSKKVLDDLYNIQEKSIAFIAEQYERGPKTVKKWIKSYGFRIRENKFASKEPEKNRYKPLTEYVSKEDLKIAEGRRKKDIVCNYKVGDPIEIYGEVRTVIQVTKELIVTRGRFTESYRIADL